VSVVGTSNETVYEKLVKPDYPIVDYNTKCVHIMFIYILCVCLFGRFTHDVHSHTKLRMCMQSVLKVTLQFLLHSHVYLL